MKLTILIVITLLSYFQISSIESIEICRSKCKCIGASILCRNSRFKKIPELMPNMNVVKLYIALSYIKKIENGTFKMYKYMQSLNLPKNRIEIIESDGLEGPMNLQKISLRGNYIQYLPDDVFSKFSMSLESLDLSYNVLKSLPTSIEKLFYLKYLYLIGNPFHCACPMIHIAKLLPWFEVANSRGVCNTPDQHKNIQLMNATFERYCRYSKPSANIAPIILNKLNPVTVATNEKVIFNCDSNDNSVNSIRWQLPFRIDASVSFYNRNFTIVISDVRHYHAGVFQCTVFNTLAQVMSSAELIVVNDQRPYIVKGPQNEIVKKGSSLYYTCRANGYPKPNIEWLWLRSSLSKIATNSKFIVYKNQLIIKNITEAETKGRIICYANNRAGSQKVSATIALYDPSIKLKSSVRKSQNLNVIKNQKIVELIEKAKVKINRVFNQTIRRLRNSGNSQGRGIQSLFRQPNLASLELSRSSEVYENVLDDIISILRENKYQFNLTSGVIDRTNLNEILTVEQIAIISQLSGCQQNTERSYCAEQLCFHKKYRSIDGKCNNLIHPYRGAALSAFVRLLPPEYENGINTPIGWSSQRLYNGFPKPSPRLVSSKLLKALKVTPDRDYSVMLMQWGQFVDHDLDFTPVDASTSRFSDGLSCNETCVNDPPCFPIITPPNDPRVRRPCIGFSRSIATCGSGRSSILSGKLHTREQVNQITSFIDASNVYSSEDFELNDLRDFVFDEGKMREGTITMNGKKLLPFTVRGQVDCQIEPSQAHVSCFKAGDHRSNENLGLLVMHTMWVREHNRISEQLRSLNNHWSGDRLFFETRKLIGAFMQHVTYTHWLPHILGSEGMKMLGRYNGYSDRVDPTISNVFATAAMRFGHTLINPVLYRLGPDLRPIREGNLPLHRAFFAPHRLMQDGGIDPIIRGLFGRSSKAVNPNEPMNTEIIEKLFAMAHEVALDLGALNIQRGRDHGLPGYNKWREWCGLRRARNFDDLSREIRSQQVRNRMADVYGHVDNVDLFAGGILEHSVDGGVVGPTFRCLLVDQFRRLRDGDRFWYENPDQFDPAQISQIKQFRLSQLICDGSDNITQVQPDVFYIPNFNVSNRMLPCEDINRVNLIPWKECLEDENILFGRRQTRVRRSIHDDEPPQ